MKIYVIMNTKTATLVGVYSTAVDAFTTQQNLVRCGLIHLEIFMLPLNTCVLDAPPSIVKLHELNSSADHS